MRQWLKRRRRARISASEFPPEWISILEANVELYARMSQAEKAKLRDDLRILVAEKYWIGCKGLEITDEVKVTIAAQACLMILGRNDHDFFSRLLSILVYPSAFLDPPDELAEFKDRPPMVKAGQSMFGGPVILAWDAVLVEGRDCRFGCNVVIHEFAHQLDDLDQYVNGTPLLASESEIEKWEAIMRKEHTLLSRQVRRGRETFLGDYAASNETEFFSVATERFFTLPHHLMKYHSDVYHLLRDYYRVDPALWIPEGPEYESSMVAKSGPS